MATEYSVLAKYSVTPGPDAQPQIAWPAASSIKRPSNVNFLLIFVHPHCPCSDATIGELNRLMANHPKNAAVKVLFVKPLDTTIDWEKTSLWKSAAEIPGVQVACDYGGTEAAFFDAATSGQTFLYDPHGKLIFHGGITSARGHAGDNPGSDAILALLTGLTPAVNHTPVFGCSLTALSEQRKATCRQ